MNTPQSVSRLLVATLALATLAACSAGAGDGPGDAGAQPSTQPVARIVAPTNEISQDGSVTVRSGTDVLLSGEDSDPGDAALVSFEWTAANPAADAIMASAVLRPSAAAIRFRAPGVGVNETRDLIFRLRVTNARQESATRDVRVVVQGVADANAFLTYALKERRRAVFVAALRDSATAPTQSVPLALTLRAQVRYLDTTRTSRTIDLPPTTLSASWEPTAGITSNCESPGNPRFFAELPALDADTINGVVQRAAYALTDADARRNKLREEIYLADIDSAVLTVRVELAALTGPAGSVATAFQQRTRLCVLNAENQAAVIVDNSDPSSPTSLEDSVDDLREAIELTQSGNLAQGGGFFDTRASAQAYYARVDPRGDRETLAEWLTINGFDASRRDFGASDPARGIARAVYLNNFDLGFGREMYSRLICNTPTQNPAPGTCDVAAVVINYPTLESAAKKLGAIVAVAMEYSASEWRENCASDDPAICAFPDRAAVRAAGGPRFVKFFAYAPDPRTGSFVRVTSVNLDGRGEKSVPQSCTTCHGGVPYRKARTTTWSGKVAREDLAAAFLLWDDDTFLFGREDAAAFRQSPLNSEDQSLLNSLSRESQVAAIKALNRQAYHTYDDPVRHADARALVEHWYGGTGFPASSQANSPPPGWTSANPDLSNPDLYDGYAKYCRTCHVVHAPAPTQTGVVGVPGQIAFANANALIDRLTNGRAASVLATGLMPAARLTYDRFWTDPPGSAASPAARFSAAVLGAPTPTPGTVNAAFNVGTVPGLPPGRASPKTLVARDSDFARTFSWSVNTVLSGASVPVSGQTSPEATVSLIDYCRPRGAGGAVQDPASDTLRARLTVVSTLGQTVSTEQTIPIENATPQLRSPLSALFVAPGGTLSLPLEDFFVPDGLGDQSTTSPTNVVCSSASGQCNVSAGSLTFTPATGTSSASVSVTATDCDGDSATGTFTVNVITAPSAIADSLQTSVRVAGSNSSISRNVQSNDQVPTGTLSILVDFQPRTACDVTPARIDCPSRNPGAADPTVLTPDHVSATRSVLDFDSNGQFTFTPTEAVFASQTFTYRNRRTEGGLTVDGPPATVTIGINQSANTFAAVSSILANSCFSCHASSSVHPAKERMCLRDGPISSLPGTDAGQCPSEAATASLYESLVRNIPGAGDQNRLRINVREPGSSELILYPADPAHDGGNFASPSDRTTVLRWIEEGAWGP